MTQKFLSVELIYKCVMDDESYFTVEGNVWQQQSYYESEDHPEDVNFICKTKLLYKRTSIFQVWARCQ
jgi:hypothetical protein